MLKKLKIYIYSLAFLISLTACQTVTNKIDQTTEAQPKKQNQKILIYAGVAAILAILVYSFI